jgi:hypothetical protein
MCLRRAIHSLASPSGCGAARDAIEPQAGAADLVLGELEADGR